MMPPPRGMKRRPGPSLAPGILICAVLFAVSASMPAQKCLGCTHEKRQFCPPGSSHCGPCLTPLEENEEGKCVDRKRHVHSDNVPSVPELEEEIDFLSAVIAKQQKTEVKQSEVQKQKKMKGKDVKPGKEKNQTNPTVAIPDPNATPTVPPKPPLQPSGREGPVVHPYSSIDGLMIVLIAVCVLFGMVALIVAAVCCVRQKKDSRLAQKVDYPAFGKEAHNQPSDKTSPGDRKLAQSAQMYHYQHQKQQMLSMEKHKEEPKIPDSAATSDEENEDGDFTVYECPGLAPTGEMEVKNPLFDDSTLQRNHK